MRISKSIPYEDGYKDKWGCTWAYYYADIEPEDLPYYQAIGTNHGGWHNDDSRPVNPKNKAEMKSLIKNLSVMGIAFITILFSYIYLICRGFSEMS